MPAVERRPRKRPPLQYDWERRYIYVEEAGDGWGIRRTFYRARSATVLMNVERRGAGWRWALLAWRGKDAIYDGGTAASLSDGKVRAEACALQIDRPLTLWSDDGQSDTESGTDIPF